MHLLDCNSSPIQSPLYPSSTDCAYNSAASTTLPMAQADVGSVERRGSRIKRRPHAESAACSRGRASGDRTRRQPRAAEATQAAAPHASGCTSAAVHRSRAPAIATTAKGREVRVFS
ncbi:hypothetical protein GW17_00037122 [Ensete ventricosum]|nr:hypothetical protein GW17_00037122 [Ensete ventricosum]